MVMKVSVLTPTKVICCTTADEVILPGLTGLVGVLEGHATLVTGLETGLLRIKLNNTWTPILVYGGGAAEIDRNRVTVLVPHVEEVAEMRLKLEVMQKVEEATVAVEGAEDEKDLLDAADELKKVTARLEAMNFLSP